MRSGAAHAFRWWAAPTTSVQSDDSPWSNAATDHSAAQCTPQRHQRARADSGAIPVYVNPQMERPV